MSLNVELARVLEPAYRPCSAFTTSGTEMRWDPAKGYVPIGFAAASGSLAEIELVLVVAEPGNPHGEPHTGIKSAYDHAMHCFRIGRDAFHQNIQRILKLCWPDAAFDEQWRRAWLTESVLCAAKVESGRVSSAIVQECGTRYLTAQLSLLSHALVVALDIKARDRLFSLGVRGFLQTDHPSTRRLGVSIVSWKEIAQEVQRRAAR